MNRRSAATLLLLNLLLTGCWSSDAPETIRVTGKITFAGAPVTTGFVTFSPENFDAMPPPVRPATSLIQPDGTYALASFNPEDGVRPGSYLIAIISYERPPGPEDPGGGVAAIPRKYLNPHTSELKATIAADGPKDLVMDFVLEGEKNK